MTRTQIQLPNALYCQAKALAEKREISLAELVRRGIEYMIAVSASATAPDAKEWQLPKPVSLGGTDPFADPDWRVKLYLRGDVVAETPATDGSVAKTARKRRRK